MNSRRACPGGVGHRFFLLGNDRTLRRQFGVERCVVLPFGRKIVFVEDGFDRTLRDARFAVDALIGMNIEHRLALVETLYGANHNTVGVFAVETGFGNNVGHSGPFLLRGVTRLGTGHEESRS